MLLPYLRPARRGYLLLLLWMSAFAALAQTKTLIDVCGHEPMQAEQCTLLIHYKGKCNVKNGSYEELEPLCTAIHDRGISADIA